MIAFVAVRWRSACRLTCVFERRWIMGNRREHGQLQPQQQPQAGVGSDLTLSTADAVAVREDVTALPAVTSCPAARRMVKLNLAIAATVIVDLVAFDLLCPCRCPWGCPARGLHRAGRAQRPATASRPAWLRG